MPLYLLTGEYDFSCRPEDTLRTAKTIPGAKVKVMREVGHFPMSENPAQFKLHHAGTERNIETEKIVASGYGVSHKKASVKRGNLSVQRKNPPPYGGMNQSGEL